MAQETLIGDLESPDPAVRLDATQRIAQAPALSDPVPVVAALVRALEDASPDVRRGAVRALRRFGEDAEPAAEALVRAALADESLLDDVVGTLEVLGDHGRLLAWIELQGVFGTPRDAVTLFRGSTILLRLADAGIVAPEDRKGVATLLATSLGGMPRHLRATAVDASLRLGLGSNVLAGLVDACRLPEPERQEVLEQVRARRAAAEGAAGKKVEGSGIGATMLRVLLVLLVTGPLVAVLVVLVPAYPLVASILLFVALLSAVTIAWFWWRCPRCRRPFAGRLVDVRRLVGAGTALVRDTQGFSHTVQTQRITTIRTYRCRHCGEVFKR